MYEEQSPGTDADDVVVEDAEIDRTGGLLHEHWLRESVSSRDRLGGLPRLTGRKPRRSQSVGLAVLDAVYEEMDDALIGFEPGVVRRALVSVLIGGGKRGMVREKFGIRKNPRKERTGRNRFDRAMELCPEIGGREVDSAVGGIGRG